MNTNETSETKAAGARLVGFPKQDHACSAPAAFSSLENGGSSVSPECQINYVALMGQGAAEEGTASPVASALDSTPTNWFELAKELCHGGHITDTRRLRAEKAVREALQ